MIDGFGRKIDYLRISVTDRCNFRCHYCMPEKQQFLPHSDLLDYNEITQLANRFIDHGIRIIRLTGGEPLVRRDIGVLIAALGRQVHNGRLDELTMTTNGSRLREFSPLLSKSGVRRINVSLDSLDPVRFEKITRGGKLPQVLDGIEAACEQGIQIRINMVAMKGKNQSDLMPIVRLCAEKDLDLALIETMPLGDGIGNREDDYIPLDDFLLPLKEHSKLIPISHQTAGPASYFDVQPFDLRLGLITPMSKNFCDDCNRLRLTTDGKIFMCLGSDMHVDFRMAIREEGIESVDRLLQKALRLKPERHEFEKQMINPDIRLTRHMNATGG